MSGKREHEENEEEGNLLESKRQKVSEEMLPNSSPPASLLPGFNYGDEDDEERRAAVNGEGGGKLVLVGHNGVEEEEEDEEQGLYQHRSREIEVRRDCPYLDAVNRQVLDFDFEKFCSLSLSNLNVYACLVCGKYYQGRGRKSHAYTHSLEAGHNVFINLRTEKVYCLPDGYEISDPSLDDIRHVLNPRFTEEQVEQIDRNKQWSRALDSSDYLPGMDTPVVPIGRSPRTDILLNAEKVVLDFGGVVLRLAGLYKADRGAHVYWLSKGTVDTNPDHILNLIHYEDVASLSVAILKKRLRSRIFLGCDNHPLSRKEVMDLVNKSGKFTKVFDRFTVVGFQKNNYYTMENLDAVRADVAKYVLHFT